MYNLVILLRGVSTLHSDSPSSPVVSGTRDGRGRLSYRGTRMFTQLLVDPCLPRGMSWDLFGHSYSTLVSLSKWSSIYGSVDILARFLVTVVPLVQFSTITSASAKIVQRFSQ